MEGLFAHGDIKTLFHFGDDDGLVNVVVAGVDRTYGSWPLLLGGCYCCPEDSFASTSGIAEGVEEADYASIVVLRFLTIRSSAGLLNLLPSILDLLSRGLLALGRS